MLLIIGLDLLVEKKQKVNTLFNKVPHPIRISVLKIHCRIPMILTSLSTCIFIMVEEWR